MLQAIATGLAYAGLAQMTTDANFEEKLMYASSNVILRELAWKVGDELLGHTHLDECLKTIFVAAISIKGGIHISKLFGDRLTKKDVSALRIHAMLISSLIAFTSIVNLAQLIEYKV